MPVSIGAAQAHADTWSAALAPYATRKGWPRRLYHACQVEVAARIITDGQILSRNAVGQLICDVANQGAVWNNPIAHDFVRLYFRPRNSFHLKTEGIKVIGSPYRQNPHMSVPIMFVFDLQRVLTAPGAFFLPKNFAHAGSLPLDGDAAFAQLDFAKIYHDSGTSAENRAEIHDARMAEVVFDRPLPLAMLNAVVCRTSHDMETLRSFIPANVVMPPMAVEQTGSVFMRREIFVDQIFSSNGDIHLYLANAPSNLSYCLSSAERTVQGQLVSNRVRFTSFKAQSPGTVWTLEVEGCLAYRGKIPWSAGVV